MINKIYILERLMASQNERSHIPEQGSHVKMVLKLVLASHLVFHVQNKLIQQKNLHHE